MIRFLNVVMEEHVVPQAIFWRPLCYFTTRIREDEDGLDLFEVATFDLGNECRFDLRKYRGHPDFMVSLYLPFAFEDIEVVKAIIRRVIEEMAIPNQAVAWRRGQPFKYGELTRPSTDRLRESEARILALKIAAKCPGNRATTTVIKESIPYYTQLSEKDLQRSETRSREQRWQQIVGNVISHQNSPRSLFALGYATRTEDGLSVTKEGLAYLNNIGFSV